MKAAGGARRTAGRERAMRACRGRVENGKRGPAGAAHAAAAEVGARRLADGATRRNEEGKERLKERREKPSPKSCGQRRLLTRHGFGF